MIKTYRVTHKNGNQIAVSFIAAKSETQAKKNIKRVIEVIEVGMITDLPMKQLSPK